MKEKWKHNRMKNRPNLKQTRLMKGQWYHRMNINEAIKRWKTKMEEVFSERSNWKKNDLQKRKIKIKSWNYEGVRNEWNFF